MSTSSRPDAIPAGEDDRPPRPFGFRTIIGLTVLYLAYRLVQGIIWLVHWVAG
ncbi:hypothetical protein BMS3Abin02_00139 [bacterium BMS3Abin02]|nr:hypothetical protein BMS3Abin02_00139 [bacterium BMS3Abin02]GBE20811.1 hypothetical protein BMS3Bbin01_00150 [bacterium BMS3Bbin01]